MDPNIYKKLYKRKLSKEEVFEATSNLAGFFELLIEIDKELKRNDRYSSIKYSKK
ncbi:MAG TPA: hypothetical protein GX708_03365 [Gallicola sp.]|nr:hypothetical protein [Gallicola sp.]